MGRQLAQILAHELDGARPAAEQTGDGVQGGGFACAVGTDQGDDLTGVDFKGNTLDGMDAAIVDVDVINR